MLQYATANTNHVRTTLIFRLHHVRTTLIFVLQYARRNASRSNTIAQQSTTRPHLAPQHHGSRCRWAVYTTRLCPLSCGSEINQQSMNVIYVAHVDLSALNWCCFLVAGLEVVGHSEWSDLKKNPHTCVAISGQKNTGSKRKLGNINLSLTRFLLIAPDAVFQAIGGRGCVPEYPPGALWAQTASHTRAHSPAATLYGLVARCYVRGDYAIRYLAPGSVAVPSPSLSH